MSQTAGIADRVTRKEWDQIKSGREGRTAKMRGKRVDNKQKTEGAADRRRS